MKGKVFYLFLFTLFFLFDCQRGLDKPEKVIIATVNGKPVTLSDYNGEFERIKTEYPNLESENKEVWKKIKLKLLSQLIEKKLIYEEAKKMNLSVSQSELEEAIVALKKDDTIPDFGSKFIREEKKYELWKEKLQDKLLIEKLIKNILGSKVSVSEEEAYNYFVKNSNEFFQPEQVRAKHILVNKKNTAEEILKRIKNGEAFETLLQKFSISPDSKDGGDLGFFSRGQMPKEFEKATFQLSPGKVSNVVKSPYGYHIFKSVERRKAKKLNFNQAKDKIIKKVRELKEEREYQKWITSIKSDAHIEIDDSFLSKIIN